MRVTVRILLDGQQPALLLQGFEDRNRSWRDRRRICLQRAEAGHEHTVFIQRRNRRQPLLLAELEVLLAAAWGDVDDARAFRLTTTPRR